MVINIRNSGYQDLQKAHTSSAKINEVIPGSVPFPIILSIISLFGSTIKPFIIPLTSSGICQVADDMLLSWDSTLISDIDSWLDANEECEDAELLCLFRDFCVHFFFMQIRATRIPTNNKNPTTPYDIEDAWSTVVLSVVVPFILVGDRGVCGAAAIFENSVLAQNICEREKFRD